MFFCPSPKQKITEEKWLHPNFVGVFFWGVKNGEIHFPIPFFSEEISYQNGKKSRGAKTLTKFEVCCEIRTWWRVPKTIRIFWRGLFR